MFLFTHKVIPKRTDKHVVQVKVCLALNQYHFLLISTPTFMYEEKQTKPSYWPELSRKMNITIRNVQF